jgi:diguanylate cyclase (GGDEF)-like protein
MDLVCRPRSSESVRSLTASQFVFEKVVLRTLYTRKANLSGKSHRIDWLHQPVNSCKQLALNSTHGSQQVLSRIFQRAAEMPALWRDASEAARSAAERDAADLLYRHGIGSILVSLLASSGLALISIGQVSSRPLLFWWLSMTTVLLVRGVDIFFHRLKPSSNRQGIQQIRRFGLGLVSAALLWSIFPLAFLVQLNQIGRAYTAIVLCGMAGGSATVLSPSKTLSLIFCAFLVLPTAILFLLIPGGENTFLGCLGLMFFVVMLASSRVAHRSTMNSVLLSRINQALVVRMDKERQRTEAANIELHVAQAALSESNKNLEERIQDRTADLEKEIQEKERYARELAYLASTDSLTGLHNRATLAERLIKSLKLAERDSQTLAVLFVDLDRFKEVNDLMGHPAGDQVLRVVAQRLVRRMPPSVEVGRWGGDEFVVAFPGIKNAGEAVELASILNSSLCDLIEIDESTVSLEATIGIALFPQHGRTAEELIQAADIAMYASKGQARSRIRVFDPQLGRLLTDRHLLERDLREAIDGKAISVVFQPIINGLSGCCETFEALARWKHAARGDVPPDQFIPLAEKTGGITAIGRWVLFEACREAASWPGPRPPSVSVNVSAVQIQSGTLLMDVLSALNESGLPPQRLQLELTERVFAGDRSVIPALKKLREKGIKISLDDFGTGYSCLGELRRLPIDQIKIDKAFVEGLDSDSSSIVKLILKTAETFGLQVVAEGIETELQAKHLIHLGAQYLQGYLFSGTLSPLAAQAWLRAHRPRQYGFATKLDCSESAPDLTTSGTSGASTVNNVVTKSQASGL